MTNSTLNPLTSASEVITPSRRIGELPMAWRKNDKHYRRKQGPVPDAYLQPIRGNLIGKDIADGLLSLGVISV